MSVDHEAVEVALNDRLIAAAGLPDILWSGVTYSDLPAEHLFVQWVRAPGVYLTHDRTGDFRGEMLVTHKIRNPQGTTRGAAVATLIADHFNNQGRITTTASNVVVLDQPANPLTPIVNGEWVETPVSIRFRVIG